MLGFSHSAEVALGVASVVMFVGTMVAVPIFFVKVPSDYFARPRSAHSLPIRIMRTVIGVALIAFGIAMLVLPGQGVLTILVGLSILDVPLKDRMILKILRNPKVHRAIDDLRRKRGKEPLMVPDSPGQPREPAVA
jgi:hypothetical protein